MSFVRYLARRLLFAVLLVLIVASAALWLTRLAPGDVTTEVALTTDAATRAAMRARYGLDRPLVAQYLDWLQRAAALDLGNSFLYSRPVAELIGQRAVNTGILAAAALLLATLIGVPLGVFTGSRRGGLVPWIVRAASLLCLSLPPLVMSLVLVFIAARTGWVPIGGMTSVGASEGAALARLADILWHVPLPALALALPLAATLERLQSQAIADTLHEPFIVAGLARGVPRRRLLWHHAWRVSLRPVAAVYGIIVGSLLGGSFVVEIVTSWPGLGRLMYDALRARDVFLVAGCAGAGAAFLAIGTVLSDVLLAVADPRVREEQA